MDNKKSGEASRVSTLHDVVLDYLTHHAYASTAQVLSQPRPRTSPGPSTITEDVEMNDGDAGTESSGASERRRERVFTSDELLSIERRQAILNYILNGAIIRAVEALHTHFPSVLDDSTPQPHSNGATPTYAPPINGNHTLLHPSHAHQSTSNRPLFSSGPGSDHTLPVFPHSSHPSHVKLNLEIQQFIESFRQLAPSSPSSPSSSISSLTSSMHMSMSNPTNPTASNGTHGTTVTLTHALTAAQGLHAEAKKLPADARAVYLQEIKDVGALFAYTNPETSILKGFLEQGRRIALAEQVNRAILRSQGRSGQPVLYDVAQRTTALYAIMAEREIDPRTNWSTTSAADEHLAAYWKHQPEQTVRFNLHDFVEQTWG